MTTSDNDRSRNRIAPARWNEAEAERLRQFSDPQPAAPAAASDPCLYCGTDDNDVPYEDSEEHRSTSQHQYAVLTS